jgi:hypothetical protein
MIIATLVVSIPVFATLGFNPRFPVLSLTGEDTLKNLTVIAGGLVILAESSRSKEVINGSGSAEKADKPKKSS